MQYALCNVYQKLQVKAKPLILKIFCVENTLWLGEKLNFQSVVFSRKRSWLSGSDSEQPEKEGRCLCHCAIKATVERDSIEEV